ncbi:MAG: hypothetical protein R3E39_31895 [Anaerolineae bacterium]
MGSKTTSLSVLALMGIAIVASLLYVDTGIQQTKPPTTTPISTITSSPAITPTNASATKNNETFFLAFTRQQSQVVRDTSEIYIIALSIGAFVFLLRMHIVYLSQVFKLFDDIDTAQTILEVGLDTIRTIVDFIKGITKHIIIAIIISTISLVIYVWMLLRPELWKTRAMMIVGIGAIWLSCSWLTTPNVLEGYEPYIIPLTIAVIGHIYFITTVIQLIIGGNNKTYFADVREELKSQQKEQLDTLLTIQARLDKEPNTPENLKISQALERSIANTHRQLIELEQAN